MNQVFADVGRYVCTRFDGGQDFCYTPGENLPGGRKAESQACILVALALARKGSFVAIEFINGDLPAAAAKIEYRKLFVAFVDLIE